MKILLDVLASIILGLSFTVVLSVLVSVLGDYWLAMLALGFPFVITWAIVRIFVNKP